MWKVTTYYINSISARRLNIGAILISTKSNVTFLHTPLLSALVKLPVSCTRIAPFTCTPLNRKSLLFRSLDKNYLSAVEKSANLSWINYSCIELNWLCPCIFYPLCLSVLLSYSLNTPPLSLVRVVDSSRKEYLLWPLVGGLSNRAVR